jgi:hypothetical protein
LLVARAQEPLGPGPLLGVRRTGLGNDGAEVMASMWGMPVELFKRGQSGGQK